MVANPLMPKAYAGLMLGAESRFAYWDLLDGKIRSDTFGRYLQEVAEDMHPSIYLELKAVIERMCAESSTSRVWALSAADNLCRLLDRAFQPGSTPRPYYDVGDAIGLLGNPWRDLTERKWTDLSAELVRAIPENGRNELPIVRKLIDAKTLDAQDTIQLIAASTVNEQTAHYPKICLMIPCTTFCDT